MEGTLKNFCWPAALAFFLIPRCDTRPAPYWFAAALGDRRQGLHAGSSGAALDGPI